MKSERSEKAQNKLRRTRLGPPTPTPTRACQAPQIPHLSLLTFHPSFMLFFPSNQQPLSRFLLTPSPVPSDFAIQPLGHSGWRLVEGSGSVGAHSVLTERVSSTMRDLGQAGPPRSYRDLVIIDNPPGYSMGYLHSHSEFLPNPISALHS